MGEDYTVSYQNNVKVGVATIVITGMGDYAGTRLAFFDIVPPQATEEEEKPSGGSGSGTSGDDDRGETTETTGEAQQNRLVVDENGQAMPYNVFHRGRVGRGNRRGDGAQTGHRGRPGKGRDRRDCVRGRRSAAL